MRAATETQATLYFHHRIHWNSASSNTLLTSFGNIEQKGSEAGGQAVEDLLHLKCVEGFNILSYLRRIGIMIPP
jgi:hypothetical protein